MPESVVYLLRHAKSSWDDPALADHDRPLARRGIKASHRLRNHFRAAGIAPALVLCSSAARAVETLDGVRDALPAQTRIELEPGLYGADAEALLARLRRVPDGMRAVLLIGHNPSIAGLAVGLAHAGAGPDLQRMRSKYPTGALATLGFGGRWSELRWGGATLDAFVVPNDLR